MHNFTTRVYYEDTDAGGILYHASHLRFAERARTEWLRTLGIDQQALRTETGLGFVVSNLQIDYHAAAHLDDVLTISTRVTASGHASLMLEQIITRAMHKIATLQVKIACVDATGMVARLPKSLYNSLQG